MWWRVLGVAVVLLCVGAVGGYAVAQRDETEPVRSSTLEPVPGVSPVVPTPDAPSYEPDPEFPPLTTAVLPTEPQRLRIDPEGAGVRVDIPVGWQSNRPDQTNFWNFVAPDAPQLSYLLRVTMVRASNVSISAAIRGRIGALEDSESNGGIQDFEVTAKTGDTIEATYVESGHLRFTTERWVSFDGSTAYASVAVTGRQVDQAGLADLLGRTITSLRELPAKPEGGS